MNDNTANRLVNAEPRNASRREWLLCAGSLLGAATLAGNVTRVFASEPSSDSSVKYPSIVTGKGNPNDPNQTIPRAGKTVKAGDIDILNFALGLEYLEWEFYLRVVAAHRARAYLTPRVYEAAQKLAADEEDHVTAILDILGRAGATPIAKPTFQFPADVFSGTLAFLDLATTFEETGTGAYLGAAPTVKASAALKFAASVYGIETRHAGLIRDLNGTGFSPKAFEEPLTIAEVTKRVTPFIVT